ncbi:MAG: dienelactone hydrolase family protein [Acidobacteriota bacterium]|nr:MAG: dienelactone hydrolase family protein [Acidobacteriota bacterium]
MSNEIVTGKSSYTVDGTTVNVFTARPAGVEKAPAIIIVHEWWGLNPHIEDVAGRFARAGFIAVAPDLYDGVTTKDAEKAGKLMSALSVDKGISYLEVVVEKLRSMPEVTAVGVTGFCMGGTFALQLACRAKVEASAPFYGDVPVDASMVADLGCPLLFIGGEKDEWITLEKMNRLDAALRKYGKDGEVRIYKGASHAFFNDTRPEVYSAADASDVWSRVIEFFNRHLRQGRAVGA